MAVQCTGHNQLEFNKEKYPVSVIICIFTVRSSSCGKEMFSHACVILSKGGVHPARQTSPPGQIPPEQAPPLGSHPPLSRRPLLDRHSPPWVDTHPLPGRHPKGRHIPWADTPSLSRHSHSWPDAPPPTTTAADGTHPTGMYSCFCKFTGHQNPLLIFLSSYHHNIYLIKFITQKFKTEIDTFATVIIKVI